MDKKRKPRQRKRVPEMALDKQIPERDIYPPSPPEIYHTSITEEQDYEYALSLIADMEKRERKRRKGEERKTRKGGQREKRKEVRDFHIKQVLRRLKLGVCNNDTEKAYISILESWMDSDVLKTTLPHDFYEYLEKKMRVPKETKDYLYRCKE